MAQAIRVHRFGPPEVLTLEHVDVGEPGPGQARVEHTAIGLNMIDTYCRSGLYPLELPSGLGGEAAGIVRAVGAGVEHVGPGDRVAYAAPAPFDAYSEARLVDARWLVGLPDAIDDTTAAAVMLKGLTAWFLLHRSYRAARGDRLLVHAAAGGVGSLLTQWAAALGARVIGVVGSEAKRALALGYGAEHVVLASEPVAGRVHEITGGRGVAAVYDSVGRDTFTTSLDCLQRHGVMVSYGNASGPVEPFSPLELMRRGSLYVTRPMLFDFIDDPGELAAASSLLFKRIADGSIAVDVRQRFALAEAADAHRALEARRTTGASVLLP